MAATIFKDAQGRVRNGWKVPGFVALCGVLVTLLSALHRALPAPLPAWLPEPYFAFAGVLLATYVCVRLERVDLRSVGFGTDARALRQFGAGLAAGTLLLLATALLVWIGGGFHLERAGSTSIGSLFAAGALMFGAALFEEALFRGYAFQRTLRGIGRGWALALFALLFTVGHPMEAAMSGPQVAISAANIFMAAVLLALCYLRTGALALPVGLHLGWNWAMEVLGFSVSGNHAADSLFIPVFDSHTEWLTGGAFGLEASALSLPVLALAIGWAARPRKDAGLQSQP